MLRLLGRIHRYAYEPATELKDFVESIYNALPPDVRGQCKGIACMTEKIWSNMDKLDWNEAMHNLAYNEVEDAIVGRLHGLAGTAARRLRLGSGTKITRPGFANYGRIRSL